jgi:2-hydroxy-4-carboxymuconate semialdehyde hemiacetal dehydrogenase
MSKLGCTLVAVAGPRLDGAASFAEAHGVARASAAVDAVVGASDIDAIVVASPSGAHAAQTAAALEGGKHVLCEVPLGVSLAETEQATRLSMASERCVMVCQTYRFFDPVLWLREMVANDVLRHVVIRLMLNRTTNVGVTGRVRSWTDDLIWHHGSHAIDLALWLLETEPAEVIALTTGDNDHGLPMDAGVLLRATSGAMATVALSYRADRPSTDVVAICDRDTYRYERGELSSQGSGVQEVDVAASFAAAVEKQDAAFIDAASGGRQSSPAPLELSALYKTLSLMAREGRPPKP